MTPQNLIISQEFFNESNIIKKMSYLKTDLVSFFKTDNTVKDIRKNIGDLPKSRNVKKALDGKLFTDLSALKTPVPIGVYTTYSQYLTVLEANVDTSALLLDNVLTPMVRWLALGVSDPSTLKNVSGSGIRNFKPNNVEKQLGDLEACFKPNSEHATIPFKVAFDNKADVEGVYKHAEIVTDKLITIDHKKVKKKIEEAYDLLGALIRNLEDDEVKQSTSDETVQYLQKVSYSAAQEIEFYGLVLYQVEAMSVALNRLYEKLDN